MKLSLDFAFEGFRIVRHNPMVILAWGIVSLVGNGLALYAAMTMAGPAFQEMVQMQANNTAAVDPHAFFVLFQKLMPAYGVLILIGILLASIVTCAVFRSVLETGKSGFGYLALGGDEIRQILLSIVNVILLIGLEIVALIAAAVVGGIIALVLSLVSKPLAVIGIIIGVIVFLWLFCWAVLRLSLNSVQSFAEKKFNIFGSFALTKGHAFTLFIGFIVTGIMAALVYAACMIIIIAVGAGLSHGNIAALSVFEQSKMMTPDGMKNPLVIGYFLVMYLLVTPLLMALCYGAPAAAYKQLAGTTVKTADTVF